MSYTRIQPPYPNWITGADMLPMNVRQQFLADWNGLLKYIEQAGSRDTRVITGMTVTNTSGLTYAVVAGTYIIGGQLYSFPGASITLPAADPQFPRIDAITVDVNGTLGVTSGMAAVSPTTPAILDQALLTLTTVFVQPSVAWITSAMIGQLGSANIAAAVINANQLNIKNLIVVGLTLTSNSPVAGKIAWSACTVFYNGLSYAIASGNTASTTNKQVTWTIGANVFVASDIYTPSNTVFLIATNTGGTAAEAWNRQGTALGSVQESNLSTSLLKGMAIQGPVASLNSVNLTFPSFQGVASSVTTNILTVNQAAALVQVRIVAVTPWVYTSTSGNTSTVNVYLKITVDGATPQTLKIFNFPSQAVSGPVKFDTDIITFGTTAVGNGTTAGDYITANFGLPAAASLQVDLYATAAADGTSVAANPVLTGTTFFSIGYALKTAA